MQSISNAPGSTLTRVKSIIAGSLGNLVEWYDWYVYSAFTLYFSGAFFPKENQTVQLLNTAGIFAIGFLMRPIGGWLMGAFADKKGRKKALTFSVLLMSLGSLVIAITPGYKQIGVAAPLLLMLARIIQGLSVGGEYGTSATYLSEMAAKHNRGFYSSFQYVTLIMGQLLALGVLILLQHVFLTDKQLHQWGWRIPFGIGAILAITVMYLRRNMRESVIIEEKDNNTTSTRGTIGALLQHPKAVLTVIGLTIGGTLAFYTFTTYIQKFLVNTAKFSINDATLISSLTLIVFMLIQPLFGWLSDKIGRKPLLIGFGVLGALTTVPLMTTLSHTKDVWIAFTLILCALVIVSGYTAINAVVKAELFPANVRALGVGFPYAIAVSLFGGSAEYVALLFKNAHHQEWFYWYVSICIALSLVLYVGMNDTKKHSRMNKVMKTLYPLYRSVGVAQPPSHKEG
jgi:MFS transporter, MHS family, alpha-ketoglutarate permease